ncbi:RNA polymerase sigma factor [Thalassoglobus neptunius]|uniref:RNA polymerase sigma factor n=1 Tax=Thalassoglobus neptunius TaxID=1938619 RepID=A0A5C5WMB3_9PLAN|nr:sigma-70 family RNA polymerase sigma factor [Thalassoglobus neptunius]TWT51758.1 RNA polymerase sigma factor [Thalassoglobus neptunius]
MEWRLTDLGEELTEGFAGRFIQRKAQQISRSLRLNAHDRDDLEQSIRLELWRRSASFDPERGNWQAFVRRAVERLAATEYRKRRDAPTQLSLSLEINGEQALEALVGEEDLDRRVGRRADSQGRSQLSQDLQSLLNQLDLDSQVIAELLQRLSVSEVARQLRMPRSTLVDRIHKLRRPLQTLGPNK